VAGIVSSTSSAMLTVASTISTVVLTARISKTITSQAPEAVIGAGLLTSSVIDYMTAISAGGFAGALAAAKGITREILAVGIKAYQAAHCDSYRTIFSTSIAFAVSGIICSLFFLKWRNQ
jgi:hypothetical protein